MRNRGVNDPAESAARQPTRSEGVVHATVLLSLSLDAMWARAWSGPRSAWIPGLAERFSRPSVIQRSLNERSKFGHDFGQRLKVG